MLSAADAGRPFTWRMLSANNRSIGRSAHRFRTFEECLDAVHNLRERAADAVVVTRRDGPTQEWTWRLSLDGYEVANSGRSYQRRVMAEAAGESFSALIPEAIIARSGQSSFIPC